MSQALRTLVINYGVQAQVAYRFGRWLHKLKRRPSTRVFGLLLFPFYWLMTKFVVFAYDIRLNQSADIGPALYIGHFGGIIVENCSLGTNCAIQQQVKIQKIQPGEPGPSIGNRVWIGAHAQILGNIKIGDNVTIGAGALVTQDIPNHSLVLGNPARIINTNYDNQHFL